MSNIQIKSALLWISPQAACNLCSGAWNPLLLSPECYRATSHPTPLTPCCHMLCALLSPGAPGWLQRAALPCSDWSLLELTVPIMEQPQPHLTQQLPATTRHPSSVCQILSFLRALKNNQNQLFLN